MKSATLGLVASLVILIAALWIAIAVVPIFGSHETNITRTNYRSERVRGREVTQPIPPIPSSLTITNDRAALWWSVYQATFRSERSDTSAQAADRAVKTCYGH